MTLKSQWLWAIGLFLLVGIVVLGVRPLVPPDEPRYGIIASEMAQSGNWLSLRMAGFAYYEKPPLAYWMMASSISVFGENAFALRLPGALATLVTAILVGVMCARITGRKEMGPAAFAVQATTIGPAVLGTVAIIDPIFTMFIAGTLAAFWEATRARGGVRQWWLALAGAAAGCAVLAKGALGLAIPGSAAIAILLWERRWRDFLLMPWTPMVVAASVIAPVALALNKSEPGFLEYFWVIEHWRRFTSPDSNQHGEPWWYFLAVLPAGGVMWTLLWWEARRGLRGTLAQGGELTVKSGVRFALAWVAVPLVLLSLSRGKVPTYILPLFPGVALLVTMGLVTAFESGQMVARGWQRRIGRWILRLLAVACVVLAITGTKPFGLDTLWESGESLRWGAFAIAFLLWVRLDRWSWNATDSSTWMMRTATAPVMLIALLPWVYPTSGIRATATPWSTLASNAPVLEAANEILVTSQMAHCVTWQSDRRDIKIVGYPSEFDNELGRPEEMARLLTLEAAIERVRAMTEKGRSIAVVLLPHEAETIAKAPGIPVPSSKSIDGDIAIYAWWQPPGRK